VSRKRVRMLHTVSLIALDVLMTALAFVLGYRLRLVIPFPTEPLNVTGFAPFLPMMLVQVLTINVVFYFNRLYHVPRAVSRVDQFYTIFGAVSVGAVMAVAISSLTFKNSIFELDYPRAMVLYAWFLSVVLITLGREAHRAIWNRLRARGVGCDRVLVVGSGEVAEMIVNKIRLSPYLGYELVGTVDGEDDAITVGEVPIIGRMGDLPELIEKHHIDEVLIALPEGSRHHIVRLVSMCQRGQVSIKIFPDLFEFITTGVSMDDLGGLPLLNVRDIQLRGWKLSLKRAMDIVGASMLLVILSPLMMLVALLVRLGSPGEIFYCQERMGLDGRPFQIVKFRTMRADAERHGPGWTVKDDPRRTRLGAFLRHYNIDEMPQFINVLLGEMSLVGPRPERPIYVQRFRQAIPRYMERHREKAGMTGWAQVNGLRGDTSIAERTKYDLWYVENWSIWLDTRIIVRTVIQTIRGQNPSE
jgi:exopolysaccharide biosynthesis polyprenyl glycosylphosphotransferase